MLSDSGCAIVQWGQALCLQVPQTAREGGHLSLGDLVVEIHVRRFSPRQTGERRPSQRWKLRLSFEQALVNANLEQEKALAAGSMADEEVLANTEADAVSSLRHVQQRVLLVHKRMSHSAAIRQLPLGWRELAAVETTQARAVAADQAYFDSISVSSATTVEAA